MIMLSLVVLEITGFDEFQHKFLVLGYLLWWSPQNTTSTFGVFAGNFPDQRE
jgi:hypothetical protein